MFGCSEHEWSSCITNILGFASVCHAYGKVYDIFCFAVERLCWPWWDYRDLCLRVVLSVKHLVRSIGHMAHVLQHFLIGFLNFCNVSLNMLYGYSIGIGSWFCSGSVSCMVTISLSSGLNLAFTSFFLRDGLALFAIIGGGGDWEYVSQSVIMLD